MKSSRVRSIFSLLLCSLVLFLASPAAFAATTSSTSTAKGVNSDNDTLKISPVRTDLTVQPGTSGYVKTFVTNLTNAPMTLQPIENDFIAGDESGTPAIILDQNSYAPTHSLKRFMVPLQNVVVDGGQTREVTVTITVPKTAQAGGYFGAIRFAPASIDGSQSVNLSASVASLILMTVPGNLVQQLSLTNFDVQQDGGTGTQFNTPNDLTVFMRFENKGNVQLAPFGQVYVQKGKKTVYTYNFNNTNPRGEILPDSFRRWTVPLKNIGKFGKYTVGATIGYGDKGQTIDITKTIWIIPKVYIIIGIAIIVAIIVLIAAIVMFLRSYKRRILRKSSYRRY